MNKKDAKFPLRNYFVIILPLLLLILGYLIYVYDSYEPFVKPLFAKQINTSCPYFKDFLGRIFYRLSYYPSGLLILGPQKKKIQYTWHRVRGINNKNFNIEKVLQNTKVDLSTEIQKVCVASAGNNLIYDNYVFYGADAESFEKLGNSFYRDRNTVYYSNGKVIPKANAETFEVLTTDECPNSHPPFAQDKFNVYYANKVIEQADRDTFKLICVKSGVRGKDKNYTYIDFRIEN